MKFDALTSVCGMFLLKMDSLAFAIMSDEKEMMQNRQLKLERRILRNSYNPFDLEDQAFKKNFRLNKVAFRFVLEQFEKELSTPVLSNSLNPIHRLTAILRFLAEGGYQHGMGKDVDVAMAQSTFSKALCSGLNILEKILCPVWINLEMSAEEKRRAKMDFYSKSGFPSVIMCVDGTHIKILPPAEDKYLYYNRKGYYSVNAMLLCDNKMQIRCVDARFPGSNHDSHIWNLSETRAYFEQKYLQGERNFFILGDGGYPLEPWLMAPFRSPADGSIESTYNRKHSSARNIIERTIGLLKNRFRCLLGARQLHYSPKKAVQITNVACALHNICLYFRVEDDEVSTHLDEHQNTLQGDINNSEEISSNISNEAKQIRNNILRTFS